MKCPFPLVGLACVLARHGLSQEGGHTSAGRGRGAAGAGVKIYSRVVPPGRGSSKIRRNMARCQAYMGSCICSYLPCEKALNTVLGMAPATLEGLGSRGLEAQDCCCSWARAYQAAAPFGPSGPFGFLPNRLPTALPFRLGFLALALAVLGKRRIPDAAQVHLRLLVSGVGFLRRHLSHRGDSLRPGLASGKW